MRYNDTYKDKDRIKIKDIKKKFSIVHQHQHSIFNFSLLSLCFAAKEKSRAEAHGNLIVLCFFAGLAINAPILRSIIILDLSGTGHWTL